MAMVKLSPRIPLRDSMFIKTFTGAPYQDNGSEQMINTNNEKKKKLAR